MSDFKVNKKDVAKEVKRAIFDAKLKYRCSSFDAVILLASLPEQICFKFIREIIRFVPFWGKEYVERLE